MPKKVLALSKVPKIVPKTFCSHKKCPKKHLKKHFWHVCTFHICARFTFVHFSHLCTFQVYWCSSNSDVCNENRSTLHTTLKPVNHFLPIIFEDRGSKLFIQLIFLWQIHFMGRHDICQNFYASGVLRWQNLRKKTRKSRQ